MKIDKILNIVKTVKQVCKNYVVLVEIGTFYYCYGKDTFIINYLEKYKIKILENNIYSCSFPKTAYNKIITQLENKRINYIVLDRRNNYEEQESNNYKNSKINKNRNRVSNFDIRFFWTSQHLGYIIYLLTNLRKSRLTNSNQKIKSKEKSKKK